MSCRCSEVETRLLIFAIIEQGKPLGEVALYCIVVVLEGDTGVVPKDMLFWLSNIGQSQISGSGSLIIRLTPKVSQHKMGIGSCYQGFSFDIVISGCLA